MKKLIALLLALVMVIGLVACGEKAPVEEAPVEEAPVEEAPVEEAPVEEAPVEEAPAEGGLVGVAMPTKDLQRWNQDGDNMKAQLEAAGYTVDLQYAANDIPTQVSQIENMIANGCKALVIASIDGESLGTVLAQAKDAGIPVIAYDRLIMNSDAVSYYATFDNFDVGVKQGNYIIEKLDLANAPEGTVYNIEFITGDPGDNNATFFFGGAISVLQPYIDAGTLVALSGQYEQSVVATPNWDTANAQARFETILGTYYGDATLHAVLASNDSTALGVANALASSYNGEYPILTGMDCDVANVKNMLAGKQSMEIFKDTRTLAAKVVEMVDALMKGTEPPINDTESYNNGTGFIPSFLCEPVVCTTENYEEILIESGYYTADQLA